ncbi:hypothetical protein AVEN_247439-1 [Araneus ventricosus]|uniref:Uncharacterized protein n=1 Tax=Araneus ventricosus TaxID=182803 RepID=A0A4Y2VHH9_ARAVE|nr:hypothetical protein AVEN_247439-1 [Araneus ventricosus]
MWKKNRDVAICPGDSDSLRGRKFLFICLQEVRKRKKKRLFDEKCEDEVSEISQHKEIKLALLQVNDRIEAELKRRFQSLQKVNEIFGFLSPKQLTTLDNKTLKENATTLANLYRDDLDKEEISVKIESFKYSVMVAII